MKSIRLTKRTDGNYGILFKDGKFQWAEDGTQAAQHGLTRLLIFKGEWVLNENMGTDWYGIIFNAAKSRAEKEFEIKARILGTPGVKEITKFNWSQSGSTVTIEGIVVTDWGETDISQEITPL